MLGWGVAREDFSIVEDGKYEVEVEPTLFIWR